MENLIKYKNYYENKIAEYTNNNVNECNNNKINFYKVKLKLVKSEMEGVKNNEGNTI